MIVVDAALIADVITKAPSSEPARERMRGEQLHAPHLLDFEVTSVIRGQILGRRLTLERAYDALVDFEDLPIMRWESNPELRLRMLQLRDNASVYDASYLALAEVLECAFVTRDARLRKVPGVDATVEVF